MVEKNVASHRTTGYKSKLYYSVVWSILLVESLIIASIECDDIRLIDTNPPLSPWNVFVIFQ